MFATNETLMFKSHKIMVDENTDGVLTIRITPCNEDFFDGTVIKHDANSTQMDVVTTRSVVTDAPVVVMR